MRYFSWIEEGRWQGNCLLTKGQIASLLQQYRWRYPVFCSTQTYDSEGKVVSCPLYFDIDGESKEGLSALLMARSVVTELESRYGAIPDIFFSGNKGYHIIYPVEITHPLCHYVAMTMVQGLGCRDYNNIDRRVYRNRAMLRLNKSPASKDGYYKIRLSKADLFDHDMETHRQFATNNNTEVKSDFSLSNHIAKQWDEDVKAATEQMGRQSDEYAVKSSNDRNIRPWTACLEGLMTTPPDNGERHQAAFILGRWAMQAGWDEESALRAFLTHDHWKQFESEERGISKMLRSLYKAGRIPTLGCKFPGLDRDLMKRHCDMLCHYNDDWSLFG